MKRLLLLLLLATPLAAATNANDDSCDISVLPAATLLLPYFEVDLDSINGGTTLFTITNVTNLDRVAHVTLWTDRAFPVVDFNVYLTGYDVQSINLWDVLRRGVIAPDSGTGTAVTPRRGRYADPNPALDLSTCAQLPGVLDEPAMERMRRAFTEGVAGECERVGGTHARAAGYATIDVVGSCTAAGPADPAYWTRDLRYDNVLVGDYQYVEAVQNLARGAPMVHIRAIPEGGTPEQRGRAGVDAGFARTFYGRYQPAGTPRLDGRQPLPAQFAARWIDGGPAAFATSFHVWRESQAATACADFERAELLDATDVVAFDEDENAAGLSSPFTLPASSRTSLTDGYPQLPNGAVAGWMYMNLDAGLHGRTATQNWVVTSMRALGRFSTDVDASAFGNGCAPAALPSEVTLLGGQEIAPATTDDSCDVALLPAATLLLPYFEVDLDSALGETTLFTITNTGARDRIARVTLWTDYAFPVISFNVYLTGYDVHSLNLYDVLQGRLVPSGAAASPRGRYADRNPSLDASACASLPVSIARAHVERMQEAFTRGTTEGCDEIGYEHDNAVGYATVDVVRNCSDRNPSEAAYWTNDIAYDNVLTGDSQQVNQREHFAQGSPLVHVRAMPGHDFPRTFYARLQSAAFPRRDARQPLPSAFAARWIEGGASQLRTSYKIWREGAPVQTAECRKHFTNVAKISEIVRFDDAENGVAGIIQCRITCLDTEFRLPASSRTSVSDTSVYPQLTNGAVSGWMFVNLDDESNDERAAQAWIVTSMRAEGRYSVDMDAAGMGNGCSPGAPRSEVGVGTAVIGPRP
ncbi:MAG TPA: hypothetical protein VF266_25345 [Thermoanaerobaculia bacterium]